MFALVDVHFRAIISAKTDADILGVLRRISRQFGFRSAYIIEYVGPSKMSEHIVDTDEVRAKSWSQYFDGPLHDSERVTNRLSNPGMTIISPSDFTSETDPLYVFCAENDLLSSVMFPVHHDGIAVGVVGYSGAREFSPQQQSALQLLSYNLFAQTRSLRNVGITNPPRALTVREKEVMRLAADGLTSQDIADRLGLSPRTVNQHVDNVGFKLNTKNRTHTVAEAIRNDLLN